MRAKFLLTLITLPVLMACSKQDSEKVDINFSPDNPKVKFADGSVLISTDAAGISSYEEVKAPYFKFNFTVNNGSDKNVIVDSFKIKLTGLSTTDGFITLEADITVESIFGTTTQIVLADVPAGLTSTQSVDFYVADLSPLVTSGVYSVEVQALGWFGTINEPSAVFSQKYFFTTR